eukprot:GGOE01041631.1.p1 GENE.GGOE01041631.1~~GGOE01041631.1.p1  ORF type:complete len:373 (+),score=69.05 GGOE01041631.1:52-1170(+)
MSYTFMRRLSPQAKPTSARHAPTIRCECGHDVSILYHCCPACARPLQLQRPRADLATATALLAASPSSLTSSGGRKLVSFASNKKRRAQSAAAAPRSPMGNALAAPEDTTYSPNRTLEPSLLTSLGAAVPCHHCSAVWPPQRHFGERPLHPRCYDLLAADSTRLGATGTSPTRLPRPRSPLPRPSTTAKARPSFTSVGGIDGHLRREVQLRQVSPKEAFALFDKDGDGVINLSDFEHAMKHIFGMEYLTRVEVNALMSRLDRNSDGVIDMPEFQLFLRSSGPPAAAVPEAVLQHTLAKLHSRLSVRHHSMKEAFQALDPWHTGYLLKADFRRILDAAGMRVREEELDALFDRLDGNHDGRVTHTEFMHVMAA